MPSLRDLMARLEDHFGLDREQIEVFEAKLSEDWGGSRIYCPPPTSRAQRHRAAHLRDAAATLPTAVVVERYGVSRSWAYALAKRRSD